MRILLNLVPVFRGGGLQNGLNLWREIGKSGKGDTWLLFARSGVGFEEAELSPWQERRLFPPMSFGARMWFDHRTLPELAREWKADVVFTPMGAGPARSPVATVVGWHDSTAAYPESEFWDRLSPRDRASIRLRARVAGQVVRRASRVCVQTEVMAERLGREWAIPRDRFIIVPNGPSEFLRTELPAPYTANRDTWRVLCIGEPKPTKNLEIVPEVARHLADLMGSDRKGEFLLTFADDGERYLDHFRDALSKWGEAVPLRRMGGIPHRELGHLYRSVNAVFLPSLLESFSATYVEAMHFGVPLVTSGRDFAQAICGEAAEYVDPLDARDCAAGLHRVMTDEARSRSLREAGFLQLKSFPTWEERFRRYRGACHAAVGASV